MHRPLLPALFAIGLTTVAPAQTPEVMGDSATAMVGAWEFSNAERTKVCTATFQRDSVKIGFKVEFDADCANLFPVVSRIAGWRFPDNDNLFLLDAEGQRLAEFSEVETGIYEAPTPGVGVLFLQKPGAGGPPPKTPEDVAGDWAITRGGAPVCTLTLAATTLRDGFALTVKPGCNATIAGLNFGQWQLDRGELLIVPARGNPWRFVEGEGGAWQRVPESADAITLVRQ
jgi:hypothetical protein